jgi:hypothetical protein
MASAIPRRCAVALATAGIILPGCGQDAALSGARDAAADTQSLIDSAEAERGPSGSTYPAFAPDVGQIVRNDGDVLRDAEIVSVTWDSDPSQPLLDSFVDAIGTSDFWQTLGKDYGIGAAVSGTANHVHMGSSLPPNLVETSDATSDVRQLIVANAGSTWPATTRNTVYALFLPPGTTLLLPATPGSMPSDACHQGIGGYHSAVPASGDGGLSMAYLVIPSCRPKGSPVPQLSTISNGHELVEAATDPFGADPAAHDTGWYGFDDRHFAFSYFNLLQGEVADVCEFSVPSYYTGGAPFPYLLPRIWSNSSAAAGHDPCVPAPPGPYFNVTPLDLSDVEVTVPGAFTGRQTSTFTTRGLRVAEGQTATFTVGFFSDGPTAGPWTIAATPGNPVLAHGSDGDPLGQENPAMISATLDRTTGQNGDIAHVTVSVAASGKAFGGELLTITSSLNGTVNSMPVWIGGQ